MNSLILPLQRHEAYQPLAGRSQGCRTQRLPLRHEQTVDTGYEEAESCRKEEEEGVCGTCGVRRLVSFQRGHGELAPVQRLQK